MRNNLKNGIIGLGVAIVLAAGTCCAGFAARDVNGKWFGNGNLSTWHWADKTDDKTPDNPDNNPDDQNPNKPDDKDPEIPTVSADKGGFELPETVNGRGIALMSAMIANEDYEDYGISTQAESAYTITASIVPDYADNQNVTWKLAKENDSDPWWSGKTLSDYITLTSNGLTATLSCKQAFGAKIFVVVTSEENSEATASVPLNYRKRVTGLTVTLGGNEITKSGSWGTGLSDTAAAQSACTVTPVYSAYTVDDTFTLSITAQLSATQLSGLKSYANSNVTQSTSMGNDVIQSLSGDVKTLNLASGKLYDFSSANGFFGVFCSNIPTSTVCKQAINLVKGYFASAVIYERQPMSTLTFKYTSSHSSYTKTVSHHFITSMLTYAVTGVTTNQSGGIIF